MVTRVSEVGIILVGGGKRAWGVSVVVIGWVLGVKNGIVMRLVATSGFRVTSSRATFVQAAIVAEIMTVVISSISRV